MPRQMKWDLTEEEQRRYIDALTDELAPLRAKAGISQVELCKLIGISRQTYSAIEGKRRQMTWQTYLSLILFFDYNLTTREMLRHLSAYPEEFFLRINDGYSLDSLKGEKAGVLEEMIEDLDEQALHALKTMLLVEYARCKKVPGDVVIKAFDGIVVNSSTSDLATEKALKAIRDKTQL